MADQTNAVVTTPNAASTKVTASHLKRDAFLYVRQSTLHQVMQNTESTQRHATRHSSSARSRSGGPWSGCM